MLPFPDWNVNIRAKISDTKRQSIIGPNGWPFSKNLWYEMSNYY